MGDFLSTLAWVVGGALVGALVVAPAVIRGTDWLVDHDPAWLRWWMRWIGGKSTQHGDHAQNDGTKEGAPGQDAPSGERLTDLRQEDQPTAPNDGSSDE